MRKMPRAGLTRSASTRSLDFFEKRRRFGRSTINQVLQLGTVIKLQLIAFFDSLSYGLMYAFLSPHIIVLGGDNLTVGILTSCCTACQLISGSVVKHIKDGYTPRESMLIIFTFSIISNLLIMVANNYWIVIFARSMYSLTNQVPKFTKAILAQLCFAHDTKYHLKVTDALTKLGLLIGPIIAGLLFEIGFVFACLLATVLAVSKIGIILTVPEAILEDLSDPEVSKSFVKLAHVPDTDSILGTILLAIKSTITNLTRCNLSTNWDLLTVKFLYTTSTIVFFSKFTQLLKKNMGCGSKSIGVTVSYMNAITFVTPSILRFMKANLQYDSLQNCFFFSFAILATSTMIACVTSLYSVYLLACIPIIVCRKYIQTTWTEMFACRGNRYLKPVIRQIGIIAGLVIPIAFGILCNYIHAKAVVAFSSIPPLICLMIIKSYSIYQPCVWQMPHKRNHHG
ncbi:unnamed protein product [Callosobruchus maculatus]|uniref:Major facilitator superfamily (MFS) profile domain-containing protein n=1 Tax=Callosobruchus maculatus TaxID=64391 RepID=A0A653C9A3_CALMS|nr:unnamed protein product [Callosobruchus maculatus]